MMKHLRSIRALAIFGALILLIAIPTSAQASTTRGMTKISGPAAFATFEYDQADIHTVVSVSATNNTVLEPPQQSGPTSTLGLIVTIFQIRISDGTPLFGASGSTTDFQLTVDSQLASARVTGNVALFDEFTGTFVPTSVDLTWSATSDVIRQTFSASTVVPGRFVATAYFNGSSRDAVAIGSIIVRNSNFTPVPSSVGQIAQAKTGAVSVQIGP